MSRRRSYCNSLYAIVAMVISKMTENLEIEYKNLLSEAEYEIIQAAFVFQTPFVQTNLYYDTVGRQFKAAKLGLRIRTFADHAEQTLKIPNGPDHRLMEITDPLTLAQAKALTAEASILVPSQVADALTQRHYEPNALLIIGQAQTTRALCQLPVGLLTLDQTVYQDQTRDYELELEVQNAAQPENSPAFWQRLLTQHHIETRPVTNKIQRAVKHFKG